MTLSRAIGLILALCVLAAAAPWTIAAAAPAPVVVPIDGNYQELFMYFITVSAGTPPKNFTVVVDTGSSDFLIPAAVCDTCAGGSPVDFYNATESKTYSPISCRNESFACTTCVGENICGFNMPYVGITESAAGVRDVAQIGGLTQSLPFGAILNITFDDSADSSARSLARRRHRTGFGSPRFDRYPEGMLGMAFSSLNSLGTLPLFDTLVQSGQVSNVFSMCLTMGGGVLVLGGSRVPLEKYNYTSIIKDDYYRFTMKDITVNGQSIGISPDQYNRGNCIVDTGTPVPTITPEAYSALQSVFKANCSNNNLVGVCSGLHGNKTIFDGECFTLSDSEIAQYPSLTMELDGVSLAYPPQEYLMKMYYCKKGEVGLGVSIEADWTIVGAKLLQLYDTLYDRVNMRIGFAALETPCTMADSA